MIENSVTNETRYGIHGYDNEEPSMHAIFMAKGPLFAKGKTLKSVMMVDLYNLFCYILNIKCGATDGSTELDIWNELFAEKPIKSVHYGKGRHRIHLKKEINNYKQQLRI